MLKWALKILKSPNEGKEPNFVGVGCSGCNTGVAAHAPSEQGDRALSLKEGKCLRSPGWHRSCCQSLHTTVSTEGR